MTSVAKTLWIFCFCDCLFAVCFFALEYGTGMVVGKFTCRQKKKYGREGREMKVRWEMWGAGRGGEWRGGEGDAVGLCFLHSFIASFFPPDLSCTVP